MASAYEGDSHDLRIVLLGVSGAGKSSIGNAILGQEAFKERITRESEIQTGRVEDRNISIIDTPGFFNTQLTEEEMQKQMMKSLDLSDPGPHLFLLVINLENFREEKRNIVEKIHENFGEEAFLFTMVLFIGRENVSKREFNQIIESDETQKILNYFEGRFYVINNKNECDPNQIEKFLKSIDEMVKNNGEQIYSNEIYLMNQRKLREQKDRMKQEVKEMQEERDTQEQKREINPKVDIKTKSMEDRMKEDNERKQEDATDLKIVILGKTGSGKSSTGNTILGRNAFKVSFVSYTQTCEKQEALVSGRTISVIDTPGLLDIRWYKHLQDELKRDIEECLEMSVPGPHVFLLVIRPNGRYTDEERNTMRWIQENFGEEAVRHTLVLFTHVDLLKGESLDQYIRKTPDLQSLIDSCGGRFHSFNNEDRDNKNQVTELLEKIEKRLETQIKLRVQREKQQQHTRPSFPTSSQEKREQEKRINQDKRERDKGDNERNQELTETEKDIHELRKETDQLFRLVMDHEMNYMDLRWSLDRVKGHSNQSRQSNN